MEKINYKIDKINVMLHELQKLSKIKKISQEQVYLQLTNYGISEKELKEEITDIFPLIINKYEKNKKIELTLNNNEIKLINKEDKKKNENKNSYSLEINISIRKENINKVITKIIDFLIKNKVEYQIKILNKLRFNTLSLTLNNQKDAEKIINYINTDKDISENINEENPFYINDGKTSLTIISKENLSYLDILAKYLYKYILLCNENKKNAEFEGFVHFLDLNLISFISKDDLSEQINLLNNKTNLKESLQSLEEITSLIYLNLKYLKDNRNIKEIFYLRYEELNSEEYLKRKKDKYIEFNEENFVKDKELLKEIITTMTYKYGEEQAKKALYKYKKTGKINYITEKNTKERMYKVIDGFSFITNDKELREKVKNSKTFRTYINIYDDKLFEKEFDKLKPLINSDNKEVIKTTKEMILENVCKETYLACENKENNCCGKTQVAISLIKIQDNNYNYITRKNNAREIAKKHITPEKVVDIIKKSLETNGYIIEQEKDLYELYATHIECLCNNK